VTSKAGEYRSVEEAGLLGSQTVGLLERDCQVKEVVLDGR